MTSEQRKRVTEALVKFVEKATGEYATSDEIAVLPEVAKVLFGITSFS